MSKDTSVTKVSMSDGREVEFPGNRRMLKEVIVVDGSASVRFDYINGETRTYEVPPQHFAYAAGHGYAQRLGDSVAGMKDEKGGPADIDDITLEVDSLHEKLYTSDTWTVGRESTGAVGGTSILMKAIMEVKNLPADVVKKYLSERTGEEKKALRRAATLRPVIQRLEDERDAKKEFKVSGEDLLADLIQ